MSETATNPNTEATTKPVKHKRRIMIYEARTEACSTAYNMAIGRLTFMAENKQYYSEEINKFAAKMIQEMQGDYEERLAEIRERYDVDECN